jgi:pyruvate dehydrogenase E1 component alpha subunit
MESDPWFCYEHMLRSRLFEEAVTGLWHAGQISGEMHLSIGEEANTAGVVLQLEDGDAMALDHRGTSPLVMRGVDLVLLLKEMLGRNDGLCKGAGGHMHLFSKELLTASSGIVGASGPAAVGFALAGRYLRPGKVAVAFFGEGAMNQGMLMESMNLAVVWNLPVVFVCKDNNWSITTVSSMVISGDLLERAAAFGMQTEAVDGFDVESVYQGALRAIGHARAGKGPVFLHATCVHPEGHFLGDPLIRIARHPIKEMAKVAGPLAKSAAKRKGAGLTRRGGSLGRVTSLIAKTIKEQTVPAKDPLHLAGKRLKSDKQKMKALEERITEEIRNIVAEATGERDIL